MQNNANGEQVWQIGELAKAAGVSADTLRHYERKGVLGKPHRGPNGYRHYPRAALDRVRMVRQALAMGFTLDELSRVLKIRDNGGAPCRQVRELATEKLSGIERQLSELRSLRDELKNILQDWDARLNGTKTGAAARLLESLASPGSVHKPAGSPLTKRNLKRKR
ncbi:MAG: heavy metal-responsive transcriptional regulator [bacterium]